MAVERLHHAYDDLASDHVREIDISEWTRYIQAAWPEAVDELPSQEELPGLVERGVAFLGPAVGFLSR